MKRYIDLKETDLKTALKIMMAESGIDSWSELAKKIEMNPNTLRSAINNDAIRLKDFIKAADSMGFTIVLQQS